MYLGTGQILIMITGQNLEVPIAIIQNGLIYFCVCKAEQAMPGKVNIFCSLKFIIQLKVHSTRLVPYLFSNSMVVHSSVARWYVCITKTRIGVLRNGKCWFILWSFGIHILCPFGIFYVHMVYSMAVLVYFTVVWYILYTFGIFLVNWYIL
jgi:hypothetical protein